MRATHLSSILIVFVLASSAQAGWEKWRADLFGDSSVNAKAIHRERPRNGTTERRFQTQVRNAIPGSTFEVYLGNYYVGTMVANDQGVGRLQLRTAQFIDDPGDGEPMPSDFPIPGSGDTVAFNGMSGTFFARSGDDSQGAQRFRLRADFEGGDGLDGDVRYRERFKNGTLLRRFKVEIEDGEAGWEFDIRVNGQYVGTLVLDDDDETEFELRTAAFIDDPGDGEPMPDDFPTLLPGDVITVGPLTAVLELD